jgi:hypothetical protein
VRRVRRTGRAVRALAGVGRWTYKELLRGGGKGGLLRRGAHVLGHVDEVRLPGLLVELGLEGGEEGIARHWSAVGRVAVLAGGRGEGGGIQPG